MLLNPLRLMLTYQFQVLKIGLQGMVNYITVSYNAPQLLIYNLLVEGNEKWYRSSNYLKKMLVYRVGIYIVVNIPSMGVHVKWDRGTRFYLTLDKKWKNQVGGLCGNYNNDIMDETMSPSKGLEKNVLLFVDSWKLDEKCPGEPYGYDHFKLTYNLYTYNYDF